jgi:uncharacterized protein YoxC
MQLLTVVTLIYVAILILALAVGLIAILYYLFRINTVLGEVEAALTAVQEQSHPLENHLEQLKQTLAGTAHDLAQVDPGSGRG